MLGETQKKQPIDYAKTGLKYIIAHKGAFLLLFAIILSLHTHWMVLREWHMPTYGNTMIHVASARHVVEHETYPLIDYSYGGGVPNLYIPAYRILLAVVVLLTGMSLDLASRFLVLLFSVMVPLGFYVLGKRLFNGSVGVFAAFLSVLPGELLIYTVRPLPQAMGLILLPVAFHAFFIKRWDLALLLSFIVTMTHQEAAAFLVAGFGAYAMFIILHMVWRVWVGKSFDIKAHSDVLQLAVASSFLAVIAYLVWQFVMIGHFNVFELAQFKNHEGNVVSMDSYILKTGLLVVAFSLAGLLVVFSYFFKRMVEDLPRISETYAMGLRTFLTFLAGAFLTYLVLNNFSFHGSQPLISIPMPMFAGSEIMVISIIAGFAGVVISRVLFDGPRIFTQSEKTAFLFLFALFAAGFLAVKNDAFGPIPGPRVFMDRFLVYLQQPLILLAALGTTSLYEFLRHLHDKQREE